ncbi:MAG: hypothetical protein QOH06_335 [Acidobacteriota bacterium]|jgi:hypothetical protein|nr:hypothetical protein [Acidobacteriota bacterium]
MTGMLRSLAPALVLLSLCALPAVAQPNIQIRAIYLDDNHESGPFNDPEVELFRAQAMYPITDFFRGREKASALFNGHLNLGYEYAYSAPDANNEGRWYFLPQPVSITANIGAGVLLIEDDNYAGHWIGSSAFTNGFACAPVADPALPAGLAWCRVPDFSGDDDEYRYMLVVTGSVAPTSQEITYDMGDWRVRFTVGYY